MKRVFTLFLSCLLWYGVAGQLRMSDLLSFPLTEDEMGVVLAREAYLSTHKFNSPWLRELDFRLRPNNEETAISDYRLRFGILNPWEIKANRDYYKLLLRQQTFERKKTINEVLERRYQLIIEGRYLMSALAINEANLTQLMKIKQLILEESPDDLRELLAMEEEITRQELAINNLKRKSSELQPAYLQLGANALSSFSNEAWITPEKIQKIVRENMDGESLRLLSDQQDLEREASMLEINKAEAFSNLGFIQTEYDAERGDTRDEHIRYQVGIQIPIFNRDRPDNQRRELELIEEKAEVASLALDEQAQRRSQALSLVEYLNDWVLLQEKKAQLEAYQQVLDEAGGTLKKRDQFREYRFFLEMKTLSIQMDIYLRYIRFLAGSGELAQQPYLNFLSDALEPFELERTE